MRGAATTRRAHNGSGVASRPSATAATAQCTACNAAVSPMPPYAPAMAAGSPATGPTSGRPSGPKARVAVPRSRSPPSPGIRSAASVSPCQWGRLGSGRVTTASPRGVIRHATSPWSRRAGDGTRGPLGTSTITRVSATAVTHSASAGTRRPTAAPSAEPAATPVPVATLTPTAEQPGGANPASLDDCANAKVVEGSWNFDLTSSKVTLVDVYVGNTEAELKLFVTGPSNGVESTGPWTLPGTIFVFKDHDGGGELSRFVVGGPACPAPTASTP